MPRRGTPRALALADRIGDEHLRAAALTAHADAKAGAGMPAAALGDLERAGTIANEIGSRTIRRSS